MRSPDPAYRTYIPVTPQPEPEEYPPSLLFICVIVLSIVGALAIHVSTGATYVG
jgi:hypothetical protein